MWLKAKTAARILDSHRDTITRRKIPWSDNYRHGRIRFKELTLDDGTKVELRFYWPDVKSLLRCPIPLEKVVYSPIFTKPPEQNSFHTPDANEVVESPSMMRIVTAAEFLDVSRDTIERRLIEWGEEHVPYRIRASRPDKMGLNYRLCYGPDVEALLQKPETQTHQELGSRFHVH